MIVLNPPPKALHKKTVSVDVSEPSRLLKCATSVADYFKGTTDAAKDLDKLLLNDQSPLKRDISSNLK